MKNLLINRALAAKKKKIFTLLLAVAASVGTMFAEKVKIGDLYYNLNYRTAEVARNGSVSGDITIPSSVTYNSVTYSVTSIAGGAFRDCTGLTSVTIPNSVTSIGDDVFYGCESLTSVTIPNSVTSIGEWAFYYCQCLTSVTIPNSVTSIEAAAFRDCTALTSVTIPNSVTSIGDGAFIYCTGLTSINVETNNPNYCSVEGVLFNKDKTRLIQYPGGKQGAYTIPNSVTSIESFSGCSGLTSVTIPNSVTSIGEWAFAYCTGLTSVTIPNSVTSIEWGGFEGCTGLTSVTIGNSVTSIGTGAFVGCSGLTAVTIPNSVTSIGYRAFSDCTGLTSVTIGNSVTSIGEAAFWGCTGLTSVTIEAETPPTLGGNLQEAETVFRNTNNCPIYVPCNAVNAYKTAAPYTTAVYWKSYADRIRGNCASSYTVRFLNWDGSVLQSTQVEVGKMPQYTGSTPARPDDEEYTYTFSGWTPAIVAVTEDATYTATFTATPKGQGIDDVQSDPTQCTKVIRDGQLFIRRGDKVYTISGQETIVP